MAGLAAADAARYAGADVVVLEARDRIGGRTWTVPLGPGSIDLGAAWVHDPVGNPVAEALASAGIQAKNDGPYLLPDGRLVRRVARRHPRDGAPRGHRSRLGSLRGGWRPSPTPIDSSTGSSGTSPIASSTDGVPRAGQVRPPLDHGALGDGGPPDRISLAGTAAYAGGRRRQPGAQRADTGPWSSRLATDLDVRLRAPVTSIDHGGDEVVVHPNGETLEGDRVIVTVPLGVLKAGTLSFDPPLGPGSGSARWSDWRWGRSRRSPSASRSGFGRSPLWQITHVADDHSFPVWFDFTRHVEVPHPGRLPQPDSTPGLAELPAEERSGPALEALRKMFGSVPDPEEILITDWTGDQWARGSYSYIPLGATVDDMSRSPSRSRTGCSSRARPRCLPPTARCTPPSPRASGHAAQALGERPSRALPRSGR